MVEKSTHRYSALCTWGVVLCGLVLVESLATSGVTSRVGTLEPCWHSPTALRLAAAAAAVVVVVVVVLVVVVVVVRVPRVGERAEREAAEGRNFPRYFVAPARDPALWTGGVSSRDPLRVRRR